MKELSKIALAVEPSTTMAIDAMFKQMKAEGAECHRLWCWRA